jgi:TonB family protein
MQEKSKKLLIALVCASSITSTTLFSQPQASMPRSRASSDLMLPTRVVSLSPAEQAEIDAANANTRQMRTAPRWKSGTASGLPDAEKALGHHGKVTVKGLVGNDGKMRFAVVETSSQSPSLDALALSDANGATFAPAISTAGLPIPVMISMPFEYFSFYSASGFGAAEYTCQQFVLDEDWAKATFPQWPGANEGFFVFMRGLNAASSINSILSGNIAQSESDESFKRRWRAAVDLCRNKLNRRFADVFLPEGRTIDQLATAQGWRRLR